MYAVTIPRHSSLNAFDHELTTTVNMPACFDYEMQGEALKSYDDCSEGLKNHMRRAFNLWGAQCGQKVELQTEEQFKHSVNDLVFRRWDSSQLPKRAPKLGSPKFTDNTIRIGRFKKVIHLLSIRSFVTD